MAPGLLENFQHRKMLNNNVVTHLMQQVLAD